jgi:hypothetical protein
MSETPAGEGTKTEATKTRRTRRTVKERINSLLEEVRELVDKHFDTAKTPSATRTAVAEGPIVTAIDTPALIATAAPARKTKTKTKVAEPAFTEAPFTLLEAPVATEAPKKTQTRKTKTKVAAPPPGSVGGSGATAAAAAPTITQEEAKKLPSCPGGPKAFNEFVKKYRTEQKEKGRELSYQEALKEAGPVFKVRCQENGSSAAANEARKAARREKRRKTQKVAFKSPTPPSAEVPAAAAGGAAIAATAGRVSPPRSLGAVEQAPAPYLNEGLDNSQGMQKIVIEDVPYFMTLADKGLFERTDDGNVGGWVGYLEEGGKIRETNQPDEA